MGATIFDNSVEASQSEGVLAFEADTTLVGRDTGPCREFFESSRKGDLKLCKRLISTR